MPIKYTPEDEPKAERKVYQRKPRKGFTNGGTRPGAGRPKGVKNDPALKHIRELARVHTPMCVDQLVKLAMRARSEAARAMAIQQLMDRAWGRAPQSLKLSGDMDNPIAHITATMTPEQAADAYAGTVQNRADEEG